MNTLLNGKKMWVNLRGESHRILRAAEPQQSRNTKRYREKISFTLTTIS